MRVRSRRSSVRTIAKYISTKINCSRCCPHAIASLDQPTMDGINTFVVSEAVKNAGVTVALSGLGGDELFAGYPSFRRALKVDAMSPISKRFLRAAVRIWEARVERFDAATQVLAVGGERRRCRRMFIAFRDNFSRRIPFAD